MNIRVYQHPHVQQVYDLHKHIIESRDLYHTVKVQLTLFVDNMYQQYQARDERTAIEVKNYHPDYARSSVEEVMSAKLDLSAFQLTIAREYGFADWHDVVEHGNVAFDLDFEQCVNLLLTGKIDALREILNKRPELLHQASSYAHRAGLIHYVAANGVELWRQRVPENIVAVTEFLLKEGADPAQSHHIYNGNGKLSQLIESSGHLHEAGVVSGLITLIDMK